jgi:uncharacterized membrane protein
MSAWSSPVLLDPRTLRLTTVPSHDHPTHPAFVHYTIAYLSTAEALDIIYYLATAPATAATVKSAYNLTPFLGDIARFGHLLNALALLSFVPAVLSGGAQLMDMLAKQDIFGKIKRSGNPPQVIAQSHPKVKMAFAHAMLNYVVIGITGYNWWTRREVPGNAPSPLHSLLSGVTFSVMGFGAMLGSKLVYEYGVGVNVKALVASKKKE